jgi:hypothetical protein
MHPSLSECQGELEKQGSSKSWSARTSASDTPKNLAAIIHHNNKAAIIAIVLKSFQAS